MEKISPLRTSMYYGLLNGLAVFVVFLIIYFAGKNPLGNWSWMGFWIPILFMILGVKAHRDRDLGGFITYGRALWTSFLVAFFGGIVFSMLAWLFGMFVGTDIVTMMIEDSAVQMEKAKGFIGEEMYEKAMLGLEEMRAQPAKAMFKLVIGTLFWKLVGGFLLSLLIAAFMKKDQNPFPTQPM